MGRPAHRDIANHPTIESLGLRRTYRVGLGSSAARQLVDGSLHSAPHCEVVWMSIACRAESGSVLVLRMQMLDGVLLSGA